MRKRGLIIISIIVALLVTCFTCLTLTACDFKLVTNEYEITEVFNNIHIVTDTSQISVQKSSSGKNLVVCYEKEDYTHTVKVADGVLSVSLQDDGVNIFSGIKQPSIIVYLAENEYNALKISADTSDITVNANLVFNEIEISTTTGEVRNYASVTGDIKISATTGDIKLENVNAKNITLSVTTGEIDLLKVSCEGDIKANVSTGKTYLKDVTCKDFSSRGSTGDVILENVISSGAYNVIRSTGDVRFERCDAEEIYITTDTGDVKGILLSEKIFLVQTDTGRISVPNTVNGGKCEITTDTGDIKIVLE